MKKYYIQEQENSKYHKDVPYLTKKQFKHQKDEYKIVGFTLLKQTDDDSALYYKNNKYMYKDNIIGKKKGYIILENKECVVLKKRIPFLFILFLLLLAFIIFMISTHKEESIPNKQIVPPIEQVEPTNPEVKENQNIPEKVEIKEYNINYELNGGYLEIDNPTSYIQGETKKLSSPKKDGYNFIGWFNKKEHIKNINSNMKGDLTLYAKYEPIQYIINYHSNYDNDIIKKYYYNYDEESNYIDNPYERKGYTFLGWYSNIESNNLYQSSNKFINLLSKDKQELDLYAKWQINEYSLVFKDHDDTIIKDIKLSYNSKINYPENPMRKGYVFSNWDKDISIIEDNTIIKANYKIVDYKINYELNDGELKDSISNFNIETDDITLPIPQKIGYTFNGWSENSNKPVKTFIIPKGSIGDKNVIANWIPNKYLVRLNPKGGKLDIDSFDVEYNNVYGNLPVPVKDGYVFENWTDNENLITSDTVYDKTSDSELTANYKIVDYSIAYDLDGGIMDTSINKYNIESDDIKISNPQKEGYIFEGWIVNGNNQLIKSLIIEKGTIGDISLKANYSPISYSIKYDSNGGSGEMESSIVQYNQEYKLPPNIYKYVGKKFIGWSLEKNGKVIYKNEESIINLTSINNKQITLYAKWETIYYNVIYYDWNNEIIQDDKIPYNGITIPPVANRRGYTFLGWDKDSYIITGDISYYPRYNKNNYTIKYDLNMGNSDNIKTITYDVETEDFTLPIPERKGYTFLGWKNKETIQVKHDVLIPKGTIGNQSYIAIWESNKYEITFDAMGGNMEETSFLVSFDSLYGVLPSVTRDGYTFEGWYYHDELITEDSILKRDYNHTLAARWQVINYNIQYTLNGGTASNLKEVYNIETESFNLPNPTKVGHTFLGWTGTDLESSTLDVTISKGSFGDRRYEANWSKNNYTVNYYVNNSLWTQKTVGYDDNIENLNAQSALDGYHTFNGWNNWIDKMPDHDIDIYASVTEAYCKLTTGHGAYGNASGLLSVFQSAGWTGHILEAPNYPNNYLVMTDYTLTRYQAEVQKNYIASHTNYTNYNFPYLYWVAINCTNGYGEAWTRPVGQSTFN